jgi:hypothetical protein
VSLNSAPVGAPVSVQYQTVNGTALAPGDFVAHALTTLTWAIGDGAAKTVVVNIADDLLDEENETFTVVLSNAVGGAIVTARAPARSSTTTRRRSASIRRLPSMRVRAPSPSR